MILQKLWQAQQMFDIPWYIDLKYSASITVPDMEERPGGYLWNKQLNIPDLLLMECSNTLWSFSFYFFWYYGCKHLDQLLLNFSICKDHLEGY